MLAHALVGTPLDIEVVERSKYKSDVVLAIAEVSSLVCNERIPPFPFLVYLARGALVAMMLATPRLRRQNAYVFEVPKYA